MLMGPVLSPAVHPRWRGEHGELCHALNDSRRFIPAGAGNTGAVAMLSRLSSGSSPLARGTRWLRRLRRMRWRFIPAGAGNTAISSASITSLAVHPRWRGEHAGVPDEFCKPGGSSPLARGTQQINARRLHEERFIPAGAGNTRRAGRVRAALSGSSPLARGTLVQHPGRAPNQRFIPAGAGNTGAPARTT